MILSGASEAVLAIDQGTTNTKALCVDRNGAVSCRASVPVRMKQTPEGWAEQCPDELWRSVVEAAGESARRARESGLRIEGIAISNQRETAVAWDRETGDAIGGAISWQCPRSAGVCDRLSAHAEEIQQKTNLQLHPVVTAGKWGWMLQESTLAAQMRELAEAGRLCLGTVDSWVLFKLTGGKAHATDHTNASRTALLNMRTLEWDEELLGYFGVSRGSLPEICASAHGFGACSGIEDLKGIPVVSMIGDSHAALAAHGGLPGQVKATYGTGSSLMMALDAVPLQSGPVAPTVAWSTASGVRFAMEGNIAMTGSGLQWVGEFLGFARPVEDAAALAETVADADGLIFVPAMAGLAAPWWNGAARGSMHGIERRHRAAHLARAAVDAIAMQVADVFEAMQEATGELLNELRADGGATRNRALMQLQADLLGRDVVRSPVEELSSVGAAWLAGVTLGWWDSPAEPAQRIAAAERFTPKMQSSERERLRARWRDAVQRTLVREVA